ncbi:hypothetical protein D9M72_657320 [compost metagenome]
MAGAGGDFQGGAALIEDAGQGIEDGLFVAVGGGAEREVGHHEKLRAGTTYRV